MMPTLFTEAAAAQENLRQAEHKLAEARTDFETAVRRLYVEGASIREIAQALGLSHQRIHQLVGGKQGSWWQRLTGTVAEPSRGCSFCGRGAKAVARLVAGPSVHICDACVEAASAALAGSDGPGRAAGFAPLAARSRQRCSFCGKRERDVPRVGASGHQICAQCAELARRMICEESPAL